MPKPWYTTSHEQFLGKVKKYLGILGSHTKLLKPFHYSYAVEKHNSQVSNTNNDTRTRVTATETIEDSAVGGRTRFHGGQLIVYTSATSHVTATETIEDSASGRKDKVGGPS